MRRRHLLLASFLPFLLLPGPSVAADEGEGREAFSLGYHQENDGPWLNRINGTDRYYTHGIAISVTHRPEWGRDLAELVPFGGETVRSGVGYLIAHEMYTPEDLEEDDLITDDHPAAGYAYLGVTHQRASSNTLDRLQFDIGAVGPITQAERIQTYAHENWGGRDPRGWRHQLENEPTLQLWLERKWRFGAGEVFGIQLLPELGLGFGTVVRQVRLGSTVRIGFNLPDDFGSAGFGSPREATAEPERGLGIFGFAGAAARAVAHNKLISGNGEAGVTTETFVGDLSLGGGVVLRIGSWSAEAHYAHVVASPEFEGQIDPHRYGSATFAIGGPYGE